MAESLFYNLGEVEEIAVNLFYGWGYNFYRAENQVRADDLLVRQKVSWLLGQAREAVQTQLSAYRRTFLPLPTREKPLPDPDAVAAAGTLERLSAEIGQLESTIRGLPVPETDRMTQRFRDELSTLVTLREHDSRLVGRTQVLVRLLQGKDDSWMLENMPLLREGIAAITQDIQARQAVLQL